jgi:hypothetical protein
MQNVSEPTGEKIRQYLLGNLADDNRAEVEHRLLTEDEFFEELLISEDELVDEYFSGRLTEGEKRQFETHFLVAPERQARFRFGRVFNQYLEAHDSTETASDKSELPGWLKAFVKPRGVYRPLQRPLVAISVFALILLVAFATYWVLSQRGSGLESGQQVLSVTLTPGAIRSGGATQRVEVTRDVGTLQLVLGLRSVDFPTYNAELLNEGKTVNVFEGLKPITKEGQQELVLSMGPPDSGDYQVKLRGVSSSGQLQLVNTYNFRVLKR